MPQLFSCPCTQRFAVPPSPIGQQVRCPRCALILLVPATHAPAAPVVPFAPHTPSNRPARSTWALWLVLGVGLLVAAGTGVHLARNGPWLRSGEPADRRRVEKLPQDRTEDRNEVREEDARPLPLEKPRVAPEPITPPSRERPNPSLEPKPVESGKPAVLFPADGQTDVPRGFPGNEVPDPVPLSKDRLAGFPVTATFPARSKVRKASGRLLDAAGKEVVAWFSSPEQPANPEFRRYQGTTLCLFAKALLEYDARYQVEMEAEVDGKPWSCRWSFSTISLRRERDGLTRRVLASINAVRRAAGLAPLKLDDSLVRGCQTHAEYLGRHAGPGINLNDEDLALPGASPEGRRTARAAHVSASPCDPAALVDGWLASFHYRFPLLDRSARSIGIGCAHGPRDWYSVVLLGDRGSSTSEAVLYPADNQEDIRLDYESGESPDPIPQSKDRRAGFPVTVIFAPGSKVREVRAEVRLGGEGVACWLSTPERPVADGFQHNAVCLIARQPLRSDSRYTATVSARVDGKLWERTWNFRTRSDADETKRLEAQALERVNQYRRLAGLEAVTLDTGLSRGCKLHADYLQVNLGHPSTNGLGMHDEDPKLPGYTPEGKKAGAAAVIATGMPPVGAIDDWFATLFHRVPLLDPSLSRIGFGYSRGGPAGWITVLDTSSGTK